MLTGPGAVCSYEVPTDAPRLHYFMAALRDGLPVVRKAVHLVRGLPVAFLRV